MASMPWGFKCVGSRSENGRVVESFSVSLPRLGFELLRGSPVKHWPLLCFAVAFVAVRRYWGSMLAVVGVLALVVTGALVLTGCGASSALRRSVEPIALAEVDHPTHGRCHEVGARARSQTLNRELTVYAGVCLSTIDGGVAADAAAGE